MAFHPIPKRRKIIQLNHCAQSIKAADTVHKKSELNPVCDHALEWAIALRPMARKHKTVQQIEWRNIIATKRNAPWSATQSACRRRAGRSTVRCPLRYDR